MCPGKDSQTVTPAQASSLDFLSNLPSVVLLCVSARMFNLFPASTPVFLQSGGKPYDSGQTT